MNDCIFSKIIMKMYCNLLLHKTNPEKTTLTEIKPKRNRSTRKNSIQGMKAIKTPTIICKSKDDIKVFFLPNLQQKQKNRFFFSVKTN